jgi:hypothetical protein
MVALATLGTASCAASTREPSPVSTAVETSAQHSTEAQKREPAGYRDSLANGDRIALPLAELFVPTGYQAPADGVVPLSLHFQGGAKAAAENFMRSSQRGVLIVAGGRDMFANAAITLHVLRHHVHCSLPVAVMCGPEEWWVG